MYPKYFKKVYDKLPSTDNLISLSNDLNSNSISKSNSELNMFLQNHKNIKYITYTIFYDKTNKDISPQLDEVMNILIDTNKVAIQRNELSPVNISKQTLDNLKKLV